MVLCTIDQEGGFRAHTVAGGGAGADLITLLGPLKCIKELIALLGPLPTIIKLIRNQEETVRCIICASGA